MDIEGAFNHTSSEVIRRAMISQGVPIVVIDWTCHMLGNRNVTITKEKKGSLSQGAGWLCRKAIGSNWVLKPDTLLWIFTEILRSRLIYASIVWWSRVKQKTTITRLERLRGLILRAITGASKSSPTTALRALMGLVPLHLTITSSTKSTR